MTESYCGSNDVIASEYHFQTNPKILRCLEENHLQFAQKFNLFFNQTDPNRRGEPGSVALASLDYVQDLNYPAFLYSQNGQTINLPYGPMISYFLETFKNERNFSVNPTIHKPLELDFNNLNLADLSDRIKDLPKDPLCIDWITYLLKSNGPLTHTVERVVIAERKFSPKIGEIWLGVKK